MNYDHTEIEKKWQKRWSETTIYRATEGKQKKTYVLDMFPYPSGEGLHVGHPKGYIATDIYSRKKRMQGNGVLHPMGWDAFGLPAENFSLQNKIHPRIAVEKNITRFKEQLQSLGLDYDWEREINTTDPSYYKWTQWIFLKLFEKGLAYQSNESINWCPSCMTGLANEDLDDGACERCGTPVEKRRLPQWVLRITEYADRLLADLETLDRWPEHIKESQRNWIGRSEGALIKFKIRNSKYEIEVFTTRPDTLFGATYMVLAPEHQLVQELRDSIENWDEIYRYIGMSAQKTEIERMAEGKEKTGVELNGIKAINPATQEEIPVFIADYVLAGYGTGAIMAVPAHDQRDFEFAQKFNLSVRRVIDHPKYAIFDFDGVIGNTFEAAIKSQVKMGNVPTLEEGREAILQYARNKPNHTRDHALSPEGLRYEYEWTKKFGEAMVQEQFELFEEFIREIMQVPNLQLAVVSSGSEIYVKPAIERSKLKPTHILCFEAHHSKEEKIELICKEWGILVKDVYYFTDSKADIIELENLLDRSKIIGCSWGYLGRDELEDLLPRAQVIENFADIHRALSRLVYTGDGVLVNSAEFDGLSNGEAKEKITERFGTKKVSYKLRDWVFSRQRYWGEPIPIIHCGKCGAVAVPEKDLPVLLPEVESYEPSGTGESPLATIAEWVNTTCPKCGGAGKRETNTMPQWAGSSWYYLRFMDPHNDAALVSSQKEKYWAPVDVYVGGAEHATRHLIYARFWHKFLYDIGVVSTLEPFTELHSVGLIIAEDGRKMSKRFGNVINPDDIVAKFGADTLRVYEMFMGPFENAIAWNTQSLIGARRFIDRVWRASALVTEDTQPAVEQELQQTIKKVGEDIEAFKFNTAVSQMMIFLNSLEKAGSIGKEQWKQFIAVLAPFAPHLAEELWERTGEPFSVHTSSWPSVNETVLRKMGVTIAVQINGKTRGTFNASAATSKEELESLAKSEPAIARFLNGNTIARTIIVPGRLVNFVLVEK